MASSSMFVLGISFGTEFSGASIAHVDDIFNIFSVSRWDENIRKDHRYLSTILYKNDGTIKCGIADSDVDRLDGVYVSNIGQYLFDIEKANKKLGEMKEGLTIQKVVADYLKEFVILALEKLDYHKKFTKTKYYKKYFDIDDLSNICYSLVYPTSELEGFMKQCFLDAEIIYEDDAEDRLKIITAAEAYAYHQLSLGRGTTNIKIEQNYLVCNIGEVSIDIAKFYADTTESFSTVELISDNPKAGSINLEYKFKKYLEENITLLNLNSMIIDDLVEEFIEKYKFGFDIYHEPFVFETLNKNGSSINITVDDLKNEVFLPFIETVIQLIVDADQENHPNIFLCGKYSSDFYFIEKLSEKNRKFIRLIEESDEAISSGAVSFRLHTGLVQIPYANNLKEDVKVMNEDLGEPEENYGNNEYDFIIGIDFGTTFSGCSYIRLKDGKPHPDCKNIKTIKEKWPGGDSVVFGKTPTLFMYDKKMNPYLWGEEARVKTNHKPDLTLLGNFKLFLCPDSLKTFYGEGYEKVKLIKNQSGMDKVLAVDVIADYLKSFKNHVLEYIINRETEDSVNFFNRGKLFKKYRCRYVITVPAMWNASDRETMAHAAIKATIIKQSELGKLLLISEPEAAAIYCEKRFAEYFEKPESALNGTRFIVCDAGGGTVDLVTFRLDTEDKEGNKLEKAMICQMGDGTGDTCGSMYLDLKFKKYLQTFYDDIGVIMDVNDKNFDYVLHQFISKFKPNFEHNIMGDSYIDIELPGKRVVPIKNHQKYQLANDNTTLRMSNEDMKTKVFDDIVGDVIKLIDSQKKQAEYDGANISGVLMVGGFSQSKYLQRRVKEYYKTCFPVIVPYEGVIAISHGAVSYALNPRMISKKYASQSLGLEVCAPFDKENMVDLMDKKVPGPHGIDYTKNRLKYFIEKDQKLDGEKRSIYIKQVQVEYPKNAVIAIFSSDSKEKANSRYVTDSHTKIMEKRINFPLDVKGVNIGDLIDFDVRVQMEHIGVTVTVECKNESINRRVSELTKNKSPSLKLFSRCDLDVVKCKKNLISYSLANSGYLFEIR